MLGRREHALGIARGRSPDSPRSSRPRARRSAADLHRRSRRLGPSADRARCTAPARRSSARRSAPSRARSLGPLRGVARGRTSTPSRVGSGRSSRPGGTSARGCRLRRRSAECRGGSRARASDRRIELVVQQVQDRSRLVAPLTCPTGSSRPSSCIICPTFSASVICDSNIVDAAFNRLRRIAVYRRSHGRGR